MYSVVKVEKLFYFCHVALLHTSTAYESTSDRQHNETPVGQLSESAGESQKLPKMFCFLCLKCRRVADHRKAENHVLTQLLNHQVPN